MKPLRSQVGVSNERAKNSVLTYVVKASKFKHKVGEDHSEIRGGSHRPMHEMDLGNMRSSSDQAYITLVLN